MVRRSRTSLAICYEQSSRIARSFSFQLAGQVHQTITARALSKASVRNHQACPRDSTTESNLLPKPGFRCNLEASYSWDRDLSGSSVSCRILRLSKPVVGIVWRTPPIGRTVDLVSRLRRRRGLHIGFRAGVDSCQCERRFAC